jgi:hypothetical protein
MTSILGIVFIEFRFVMLVLLLLLLLVIMVVVLNDDINVDSTMFVDEPTSFEIILLVSVFGRRSLTLSNSLASSNENFFSVIAVGFLTKKKLIYKFVSAVNMYPHLSLIYD